MPFLTQWQINGNEYFLDGSGNKVAVSGGQYEYNGSGVDNFRRIASSTCSIPFVRSFKILKKDSDNWNLSVNQNKYIGRYPSQDAAVQVLVGLATRSSGSTMGLTENFDHQLSFGFSTIDTI